MSPLDLVALPGSRPLGSSRRTSKRPPGPRSGVDARCLGAGVISLVTSEPGKTGSKRTCRSASSRSDHKNVN